MDYFLGLGLQGRGFYFRYGSLLCWATIGLVFSLDLGSLFDRALVWVGLIVGLGYCLGCY